MTARNIEALLKSALKEINSNIAKYFLFLDKTKTKISINKDALNHISELCEGDARDAYNALELAIIAAKPQKGIIVIDRKLAEEAIQ